MFIFILLAPQGFCSLQSYYSLEQEHMEIPPLLCICNARIDLTFTFRAVFMRVLIYCAKENVYLRETLNDFLET